MVINRPLDASRKPRRNLRANPAEAFKLSRSNTGFQFDDPRFSLDSTQVGPVFRDSSNPRVPNVGRVGVSIFDGDAFAKLVKRVTTIDVAKPPRIEGLKTSTPQARRGVSRFVIPGRRDGSVTTSVLPPKGSGAASALGDEQFLI